MPTCHCGAEFDSAYAFLQHVEDAGHIKCSHCDATFSSVGAMAQHEKNAH